MDWLKAVYDFDTAEAVRDLERRAGGAVGATLPRLAIKAAKPAPIFKPVAPEVLERHYRQAARLRCVPLSMKGRGFTLPDLKKFGCCAEGDDALFPVFGPNGTVLNIKRRKAHPKTKLDRYTGLKGHGSPAWCSPDFLNHNEVLVIEGELNAMACSLARLDLGVMGVAGTSGSLHLDALKGRTVYVYADDDEVGREARDKWAAQAQGQGQGLAKLTPLTRGLWMRAIWQGVGAVVRFYSSLTKASKVPALLTQSSLLAHQLLHQKIYVAHSKSPI